MILLKGIVTFLNNNEGALAMLTEPAEDPIHILLCDHADELDICRRNGCSTGAQGFFDDGIVDLPLGLLHEHLPDGKGALIGAELLGVHLATLGSAVHHIKHIHGAVADIRNEIHTLHGGSKFSNGGITLWVDSHIFDGEVVVDFLVVEVHFLVLAQVGGKLLLLPGSPGEGKPAARTMLASVSSASFSSLAMATKVSR